MSSLDVLVLATILLFCRGSLAAFTAHGTGTLMSPPVNTTAVVDAVMMIEGPTATSATIMVTISNITGYTSTLLTIANSTADTTPVVWLDPVSQFYYDASDPQAKDISGSLTFTYTFTSKNFVGPVLGYPTGRMTDLWTACLQGSIYIEVSTYGYSLLVAPINPVPEYYVATLNSSNVIPAINGSTSAGLSTLMISPDYNNATVELAIKDVPNYFMSHIHYGNATVISGMIALWINPISEYYLPSPTPQYTQVGIQEYIVMFNASNLLNFTGQSLLPLSQLARSGSIYANVHSLEYPAGAIRGQYMPMYAMPSSPSAWYETPPVNVTV